MKKIMTISIVLFLSTLSVKAQDSTVAKIVDSISIYVGKYKFGEGSPVGEVTVAIENGKLVLKSKMGNAELEKGEGTDQFTIPSYQGVASFFRNESKKVSGVHIEVMGRVLDGDKEVTP
jgi:hypothetical protein